jgi:hypothetical protein
MHIFRHIFLSNYWWQRSDIWSQALYRYPISWEAFLDPSDSYLNSIPPSTFGERGYNNSILTIYPIHTEFWWHHILINFIRSDIWSQALYRYPISWEAFLDPSDSYFLFVDFVDFYTHLSYIYLYMHIFPNSCWGKCDKKLAYIFNVYKNQQSRQTGSRNLMGPKTLPTIWGTYMKLVTMHIFRRIFLSNYWWQESDIWSQASYRYAILWEAFLDPSNSYFLFAETKLANRK